ncbi:uncharacterized protein KY384_009119 [Bacidia gigantensis]|uniref:uncharacterized protein n=1 Tax=Bacidia gigantensis TaxID=2732470 RepID=UPI001D04439F|nr:uncharacterized protein KY384_009119 [Bacidia gigantensis]KAG8525475.1 hypothetical protein KY384_009119 [Bacidia gigantensis]
MLHGNDMTKPFSISFGSNKSKQPPAPLNGRKRPRSALEDHDLDNDSDQEEKAVAVTAFDAKGAVSAAPVYAKSPLVIQPQKNRDWREESRRKRGKNLLPAEIQASQNRANGVQNGHSEQDEVSLEAGLKIMAHDQDGDTSMTNGHGLTTNDTNAPEPEKEQTADDAALEALLGQKRSTLVIPSADSPPVNDGFYETTELSEDARVRADVASRPPVASLDDYARVPVFEYGTAMLRGMGWSEGQSVGRGKIKANAPRKVERRPALLGLGAAEVPGGVGEELGAWGKATKGNKKNDISYSPVTRKDKITGELLTEAEFEAKKAEANKPRDGAGEDWRERRDRNLAADKERKRDRLAVEDGRDGDHRRRDRSRSKERRRHGESKRDRSRSGERSRHSSSRRERSRSVERSRHGSSRRERSKSRERRRDRRDHDDCDKKIRDYDKYDKDRRR